MLFRIIYLVFLINNNYCYGRANGHISDKDYAYMPALFKLDDYDQCMQLEEEPLYCTITFELEPLYPSNDTSVWNIIKNVSLDPRNYRHDHLRHGICVPLMCPNVKYVVSANGSQEATVRADIETCYNQKYRYLGLKGNVTNIISYSRFSSYPIDIYSIAVGCFLISYIVFVMLASIYEGVARYQKREVYDKIVGTTGGKFILAFSIPKNWHRLTSINDNSDAKKLRSIQGIRFYNMICVILCHTIMVSFAGPVSNTRYTENMTNKMLNMFVANGQYAVQTFFLISGWLLSFHFFQIFEKKKKISIKFLALAFINRYIRLTPTLAIAIAFESTWLVHMGDGPQWDALVGQEYINCRNNWWTNLLYINNYVNAKNMCLHQTWYIASDTQLFFLSLIILCIIWKYQGRAYIIFGVGMVMGLVIQGSIAFINNYDIVIRQYPEALYGLKALQMEDWQILYSSGHSNITGYIIGLTFGYTFYKYRNKKLPITKMHIVLWWILTFGMCNFIILIAARMYEPDYTYTRLESAMYWAFGKNIFALGIAIGIFGMSHKVGWFVRWFCEWKSVQIFGRLTYSTYIIHSALIRVRAGYLRSPLYANDYLLFTTTLGDIVLSYLGGTLVCLLVEMPISALQKLMVPHTSASDLKAPEKSHQMVDDGECAVGHYKQPTVCSKV